MENEIVVALVVVVALICGCVEEKEKVIDYGTKLHNVSKLLDCKYDFMDFNSDILVSDEPALYVVNYNTIEKYRVVNDKCVFQWRRIFQSDDQQIVSNGKYLWVSSRSHDAVGKFDLDGKEVPFKLIEIKFPKGLYLNGDWLYVAEFEGDLKRYDAVNGGKAVLTIPLEGYVFDVALDSSNNTYVITSEELSLSGGTTVMKFNTLGELLDGGYIKTKVSSTIQIDGDDNIYIMDSNNKNEYGDYYPDMVKKYSHDGRLLNSWTVNGITSFTLYKDKIFIAFVEDSESGLTCFNVS